MIDLLLEDFKKVVNRSTVKDDRAIVCLTSAISQFERLTRRNILFDRYLDRFLTYGSLTYYVFNNNPVWNVISCNVNYQLVDHLDSKALLIPGGAKYFLVEVEYEAGYFKDKIEDIPADIREVIYYLADFLYTKFEDGTIGLKAISESGLFFQNDIEEFFKSRIYKYYL